MKTEIFIPSSGIIELYDDVAVSLNYNIANIRTPEKRNADFSKTITVPGTANNNKLLAHIFEIGVDRLFNPNHKAEAWILVDKVAVMKGILRLARIKTENLLHDVGIEYELEIKGRLDDLFTSIKDRVITDITWSDLDHTWNKTNIFTSWSTPAGTGYVYPFIDYGVGILSPSEREVISFRPATYVKEIWDRIFSYAGFQYSSTFLNTDFFKRQIIPFYNEKFVRTQTQISNNIFRAHRTTNQSFSFSAFDTGNFANAVTSAIRYNDDSTAPSSDAGNNYNIATGKFTASEPGVYTFTSYNTVTFQHNSPGNVTVTGYFRTVKNGTTPVAYSQNILAFPLAPSPSSYTATNIPTSWTGFLNTGETVEIQLYFIIQNSFNTTFPTVQANFVATNSYFYNALDASYSFNSSLSYAQAVPQNLKMEDFIMSIIRRYNLYFEYDKDTPNKIFIEPRNDYFTFTVQDWSSKLDESQEILIEPMGALDSKRYIFKDKPDKDWLNEKYQSNFQQIKDESYGTRIINVDNDFLKNDNIIETIFAPTPQYSDTTSDRFYPKIVKVDPVTNVQTPITALPRLLYYSGLKSCQSWSLFNFSNNSGTSFITYPHCGHIDIETAPTLDLCWGVPKEVYYTPPFAATYSNNNSYNRFWKQFIDEITDKDSSIVTAWFRLTPADIAILDFRHFYRFGFQNYRLNKIYDYNPVQEGLTKCEFIKTKATAPFVYENILTLGGTGTGTHFPSTNEAGPSFPFTTLNPVGPIKIVSEGGHGVPPSASSGVIVSGGAKNIVGDNVKSITILQSSGVTVIHNNVTIIQSSGISSTGDNQLWIYNTLVTSGAIAHMALGGCPEPHTVAEMQAMATSGLINPCEEYLITDAYNNWGLLKIAGRTTTKLEPEGTIYISSDGYVANVGYDLTYDQLTHIFHEHENNLIYNPSGNNRNGNCIEEFPRGNDNYVKNTGIGFNLIIQTSGNCIISDNNLGQSATLAIDGSSGFTNLSTLTMGSGVSLTINGSSISDAKITDASIISLTNNSTLSKSIILSSSVTLDGSTLTKCMIEPNASLSLFYATVTGNILGGLTISFPPGTWTGNINKVDGTSTFETTLSVTAGAYDFIRSSVDYGFCGIFRSTSATGAINVTSFTNASLSGQMNARIVKIFGSATGTLRFVHDATNIFGKGAVSPSLVGVTHWVEFYIVTSGGTAKAYEYNKYTG